jgi:hypothetical protein
MYGLFKIQNSVLVYPIADNASRWADCSAERFPMPPQFTKEQELSMALASLEYLSNAKDEIFELFQRVRDEFDGSEYMQGKKDGLRIALALMGMPEMLQYNRGGGMAREAQFRPTPRPPDKGGRRL